MNTDWMTGLSTEVSSLEYTDFGALSLSIKGDPIRKEEDNPIRDIFKAHFI